MEHVSVHASVILNQLEGDSLARMTRPGYRAFSRSLSVGRWSRSVLVGGGDDKTCAPDKDVDGDKSKFEDGGEPRLSVPLRPGIGIPFLPGGDSGGEGEVNASSFTPHRRECSERHDRTTLKGGGITFACNVC